MRLRLSVLVLSLALAIALSHAAGAEELVTEYGATLTSTTNGQSQAVSAVILKPIGPGPYPAIVIAHDCSGMGPRSSGAPRRWGNFLAGEGYAVIIPDSFTARGYPDGVCTVTNAGAGPALRLTLPDMR